MTGEGDAHLGMAHSLASVPGKQGSILLCCVPAVLSPMFCPTHSSGIFSS
jgi:hypothetical protein